MIHNLKTIPSPKTASIFSSRLYYEADKLFNDVNKFFGSAAKLLDYKKFLRHFDTSVPENIQSKFYPASSILHAETSETQDQKANNILVFVSTIVLLDLADKLSLAKDQQTLLKELRDTSEIAKNPDKSSFFNTKPDASSDNYKKMAKLAGKFYFSLTAEQREQLENVKFFNLDYEVDDSTKEIKLDNSSKLQNLTISRASQPNFELNQLIVDVDTDMLVNTGSGNMKVNANISGAIARSTVPGTEAHTTVRGAVAIAAGPGTKSYSDSYNAIATATASGAESNATVADAIACAETGGAIANANAPYSQAHANAVWALASANAPKAEAISYKAEARAYATTAEAKAYAYEAEAKAYASKEGARSIATESGAAAIAGKSGATAISAKIGATAYATVAGAIVESGIIDVMETNVIRYGNINYDLIPYSDAIRHESFGNDSNVIILKFENGAYHIFDSIKLLHDVQINCLNPITNAPITLAMIVTKEQGKLSPIIIANKLNDNIMEYGKVDHSRIGLSKEGLICPITHVEFEPESTVIILITNNVYHVFDAQALLDASGLGTEKDITENSIFLHPITRLPVTLGSIATREQVQIMDNQ